MQVVRFIPLGLLLLHVVSRMLYPSPSIFIDLILFNVVGFAAAISVFRSPNFNDIWARLMIGISFLLWTLGSILSTWDSVDISTYLYAIFYPLMFLGIFRVLSARQVITATELLDVIIVALGASGLLASLLLKPAMLQFDGSQTSIFLAILYPIGDVVLLGVTIPLVVRAGRSTRSLLCLSGIFIFDFADLYFLWQNAHSHYTFGALTDDGWLIGLCLIAESLWHHGGEREGKRVINSSFIAVALTLSTIILAISALRPGYFPAFALIPAFGTIGVSFIRMASAIHDAQSASKERELARTDELTGLPNRRRFMIELNLLLRRSGSLLIIDLDGFKSINDTFGHDVGDEALRQVALRFGRAMPQQALLARLGGDEFGVILHGSATEPGRSPLDVAERLRETLSYPLSLSVGAIPIGVSIGEAMVTDHVRDVSEILRRADRAMYQAKREKCGIVLWSSLLS